MFSRTHRRNRAKSLGKQAIGRAVACVTEPLERRVLLSSSGQLFVANSGNSTIGQYTTSGVTLNAALVSGLAYPDGLAVSGTDLFVSNYGNGTIGEYTTSGVTVNAALISGLNEPEAIVVSGSDLFVVNNNGSTIGEYTTSGTTVNAALLSGLGNSFGFAVSGSDMFVPNVLDGTIGEYTTSGATVNASLVSGLGDPQGIAVSGNDLFVANYNNGAAGAGTIGEYTTSGATVNATLVSGLNGPVGPVVSGTDLFVVNYGDDTIGEYTTLGMTVNASLISGLSNPFIAAPVTTSVGSVANLRELKFHGSGSVTTSLTNITQTYVQYDDKPIVVGSDGNDGFAMQRFTTAGVSDFVSIAAINGVATSVAEDPSNDDLLLCGFATVGGSNDLAFARFTPGGNLDTTFGSNGVALGPAVSTDGGYPVFIDAIQKNGQILVADQLGTEFSLSEYYSNLTPDTNFGNNGHVVTQFSKHYSSFASAIAIQGNGYIVVAGIGGDNINLARYTPNGSLDTSFGSGGIVTTTISGLTNVTDVVVNANGEIDVAGYTSSGGNFTPVVVQYHSDGTLDTGFGSGGIATGSALAFPSSVYLVLNAEGEIFELAAQNLSEVAGISAGSVTEIYGLAYVGTRIPPPDSPTPVPNVVFTLFRVKSRKKTVDTGQTQTSDSSGQFAFTTVSLGTTYQVEQTYAKKYTLAATSSGSITVVSGPNGEEYYAEQEKVKHAVAHPDLVEKVASLPPSYAFSIQGVITSDLQVQPGSGLLMEAQSEKVYS